MPLPNPVFLLVPYRYSTGSNSGSVFSQLPTNGTGDFIFTRSTTGSYINSSGFIATSSAHEPRIFNYYSGSNTCPGFLIEPSAQNLCLQSEALNTSPWTLPSGYATITPNAILSPANTLTADQIIYTTESTARANQVIVLSNSTTYTLSAFIKNNTFVSGEVGRVLLRFENNLNSPNDFDMRAVIDPTNIGAATFSLIGTAGTGTSGTVSGSVQDYGNGWWRVRVTGTTGAAAATATANLRIQQSGLQSVGDNITRSLYVWGVQLETGSVATSYIPTTTAAVTRNADVLTDTSYTLPTPSGSIYSEFIASRTASYYVHSVGPVPITTGSNCIAITYTNSNISVYKNGAFVVSQSIGTYPIGGNIINLGHSSGSFQLNDNLLSFAIYDSTLSAADAISLTSGSI